jgi:formate hydrogenlyase subunit 6/NADH:ubiquinone oxidoreductase subunit I
MPFKITPQCSGTDTICEDVCSYNCVTTVDAAPSNSKPHFQINEEQCTDCGACALACPESAIVYAEGFRCPSQQLAAPARRVPTVGSIGGRDDSREHQARSSRMTVEVPEGFLLLNGKIESWARLMAASSD